MNKKLKTNAFFGLATNKATLYKVLLLQLIVMTTFSNHQIPINNLANGKYTSSKKNYLVKSPFRDVFINNFFNRLFIFEIRCHFAEMDKIDKKERVVRNKTEQVQTDFKNLFINHVDSF